MSTAAPPGAASMASAVDAVAARVLVDVEGARVEAVALRERASAAGEPSLAVLAGLVAAEADERRGRTALAAAAARAALAWGEEHGDDLVRARALRLMSKAHDRLGDGATALELAVASLEVLPAGVSTALRASHETSLGLAYLSLSALDDARARFERVLVLAEASADDALALRTFNNLAYTAHLAGDAEASTALVEQLVDLARRRDLALSAAVTDTVATSHITGGRFEQALEVLGEAVADVRRLTEVDDRAFLHVRMAVCSRELGRFDEAAAHLDVAEAECSAHDLDGVRLDAMAERSALAAASGDHRLAYELHVEFHARTVERLSASKDARARVLAAVFDTDEAQRASRRYRDESLRDHLTGVVNRRGFDELGQQLAAAAARDGSPLSLVIVDLDHFKRVNDECSHHAGDVVLQRFARLLEASCPGGGLAARLGGEEFVLLLPAHDAGAAARVAGALLARVRGADFSDVVGALAVTASAGVASAPAGAGVPALPALLAEADRLLYQAKRAGRDRVAAEEPVLS